MRTLCHLRQLSQVLTLTLVVCVPAAASASAKPLGAVPAQARAEAKSRYDEGVRAYQTARYKDAVDRFLEADALWPSAPLSFNTALAYDKLLDKAGALRFYRDYLRRDPKAKNAAKVQARINELERQLALRGVQQITVMSEPAGATLSVDGQPKGITPWTGELPLGPHEVTLTLRGYRDAERRIELVKDRAIDVTLSLSRHSDWTAAAIDPNTASPPEPAPPVAVPKEQPQRPSKRFGAWPWVSLGAGGAALAAASFFELARRNAEGDAESATTQLAYWEHSQDMRSRQTTARVLVGVGGALALTGGVLLFLDSHTGPDEQRTQTSFACAPGACLGSFRTVF